MSAWRMDSAKLYVGRFSCAGNTAAGAFDAVGIVFIGPDGAAGAGEVGIGGAAGADVGSDPTSLPPALPVASFSSKAMLNPLVKNNLVRAIRWSALTKLFLLKDRKST